MNIDGGKVNIDEQKANIEDILKSSRSTLSPKTISNILTLYQKAPKNFVFGRYFVEETLNLKPTRASALIKLMKEHHFIEPVLGQGKSKYKFPI